MIVEIAAGLFITIVVINILGPEITYAIGQFILWLVFAVFAAFLCFWIKALPNDEVGPYLGLPMALIVGAILAWWLWRELNAKNGPSRTGDILRKLLRVKQV